MDAEAKAVRLDQNLLEYFKAAPLELEPIKNFAPIESVVRWPR